MEGYSRPNLEGTILEFLTHKTTCATEMLEKTTCRKICQKRPPTDGGTSGHATRGTCRLGRRRQVHAATAKAGMWLGKHPAAIPIAGKHPAAIPVAGKHPATILHPV
jgi:hypothetical protein